MKTTTRDAGSYNVSIWRVGEDGAPISVQAGRFVDGKVIRAGGSWTGDNGTEAYHAPFIASMSRFCGQACKVVVTGGTQGVIDSTRMRIKQAFERAQIIATF